MMSARLKPDRTSALQAAMSRLLTAILGLASLYLVFQVHAAGQTGWAMGLFAMMALGFFVYLSNIAFAYRYLFPGLAAMAVFVAFPLLYTAQIGFTNFSSAHLLSLERARAYLLEQSWADDSTLMRYALHRDGDGWRIALADPAVDPSTPSVRLISPVLALRNAGPARVAMQPIEQAGNISLGQPLPLPEMLRHRDALMALELALPDGSLLRYAGVREFAKLNDVWRANGDGSLTLLESGAIFRPNPQTGYFEGDGGERLQPGYKVGVGFDNYTRMIGDPDFRGPFLSIFVWTVVFSALTVLFTVAIGLPLAVLLNWESLRFRTVYRTLLFLPYAVPAFISILVFKGLFNQNFGEINAILNALFGVRPAWFADPFLARTMILIVNTWLGYPYIMVLCSGLIKSIPADLYEASAIAGASPLTNFFKITAPLIVKPLAPLLITVFAFNFNNFVVISLLTDGRPDYLNTKLPAGTTDILVSYTYRIAFQDSGQNFGLAAAISTVIFLMVAALSVASLKMAKINARDR